MYYLGATIVYLEDCPDGLSVVWNGATTFNVYRGHDEIDCFSTAIVPVNLEAAKDVALMQMEWACQQDLY